MKKVYVLSFLCIALNGHSSDAQSDKQTVIDVSVAQDAVNNSPSLENKPYFGLASKETLNKFYNDFLIHLKHSFLKTRDSIFFTDPYIATVSIGVVALYVAYLKKMESIKRNKEKNQKRLENQMQA